MNSVKITRTFNASVNRLWDAWTDENELKQWFAPGEMTVPVADFEKKLGGAIRICMQDPTGKQYCSIGTITSFEKPTKLAYTWKWEAGGEDTPETTVTISFKKIDDKRTEVTLVHSGFATEKDSAEHNKGWIGVYDNLEKHLI